MTTYRLAAVIEKDPDGYFGFCPGLHRGATPVVRSILRDAELTAEQFEALL